MNAIGTYFRFTSFGESHGPAIGGVVDGMPSGIRIDEEAIAAALMRRRMASVTLPDGSVMPLPGGSTRAAGEEDKVEWLSGLLDGVTLGTPIAFILRNTAARPADYEALREVYRPGHADRTYHIKYGVRDPRGGGRASARETAARVVAGCLAKQVLGSRIRITAQLTQVGSECDPAAFAQVIDDAHRNGDSIGGIVSCCISGVPAGWGEPIFDKVQSRLAAAMLSIPGCKGFDYGTGFSGVGLRGSEANPISGGMLGGITDGTDICFRCVFKPTPSISLPQKTTDIYGDEVTLRVTGRHDACIAARAPQVVEAMSALVLADLRP